MRALPLFALALIAACHHSSSSIADDAAPADGSSHAPDAAAAVCNPVQGTPTLGLQTVASGFDKPVYLTAPVNDPRLFVLEKQTGNIEIVKNGSVLATPFLTIAVGSSADLQDERGLLGLAFPPDYTSSGKLYVYFVNTDSNEEIDQYTVSANPDVADASSRQEVWSNQDPYSNHNGGTIGFGPDGYLYFAVGDGGSAGDPLLNGQNIDVLFAKMNRIDVSSLPYTSPPSNPFAGSTPGADEIWAYGLRNPYRWSFDRQTGDIYIGDVGQGSWEEVDVLPAGTSGGQDFGWSQMEGTHCYNPQNGCTTGGMTDPVIEYDHQSGDCAVIGGFVYRGCQMPGYAGTYFYADYCGHWVKSFQWAPGGISAQATYPGLSDGGDIVAIGQDGYGELYLVEQDMGLINKIVPQ